MTSKREYEARFRAEPLNPAEPTAWHEENEGSRTHIETYMALFQRYAPKKAISVCTSWVDRSLSMDNLFSWNRYFLNLFTDSSHWIGHIHAQWTSQSMRSYFQWALEEEKAGSWRLVFWHYALPMLSKTLLCHTIGMWTQCLNHLEHEKSDCAFSSPSAVVMSWKECSGNSSLCRRVRTVDQPQ